MGMMSPEPQSPPFANAIETRKVYLKEEEPQTQAVMSSPEVEEEEDD